MSEENFEPSMQPFAIYNEGVPNSVYAGQHPEHEIVSHIPDEAIDEIFPASAEDVAEMEAAEDFVEQMAWISYLDEQEEQARTSFVGFGKRWESRRKSGLLNKPHQARTHHDDDSYGSGSYGRLSSVDETALVTYTPRVFEVKPKKQSRMLYSTPKHVKGAIHQPRRQYSKRTGHW